MLPPVSPRAAVARTVRDPFLALLISPFRHFASHICEGVAEAFAGVLGETASLRKPPDGRQEPVCVKLMYHSRCSTKTSSYRVSVSFRRNDETRYGHLHVAVVAPGTCVS